MKYSPLQSEGKSLRLRTKLAMSWDWLTQIRMLHVKVLDARR